MCSKILPNKSLHLGQINQQSVNFKPILDGNDAKHEFGLKRGRNGEKENTGMEVDSKPKPRISERAIRILFGEMENAGVQQFRGSMCNSKNTPHTLTFDFRWRWNGHPFIAFLLINGSAARIFDMPSDYPFLIKITPPLGFAPPTPCLPRLLHRHLSNPACLDKIIFISNF